MKHHAALGGLAHRRDPGHLELRRRNAVLEVEMPLANYMRTRESESDERVEADGGSEEDDTLATVSWPTPAA